MTPGILPSAPPGPRRFRVACKTTPAILYSSRPETHPMRLRAPGQPSAVQNRFCDFVGPIMRIGGSNPPLDHLNPYSQRFTTVADTLLVEGGGFEPPKA